MAIDTTRRSLFKMVEASESGQARVFVDYDHHPSTSDVRALEALGASVTMRPVYLDSLIANVPLELIHPSSAVLELPELS